MPRPGPRPYECVRRAWHSDRHQPMRGSLIQEIFRVVNEIHSSTTRKNKEWQDKLPIVVLKVEEIIYSKANSEAEYMNLETLWDRANDAINTIIRLDETTETGVFLQPCIEAALNLGCTPMRTSRSQRNNTSTYYLHLKNADPHLCPSKNLRKIPQETPMTVPPFVSHYSQMMKRPSINMSSFNLKPQIPIYPNDKCLKNKFSFPSPPSTKAPLVYPLYYGSDIEVMDPNGELKETDFIKNPCFVNTNDAPLVDLRYMSEEEYIEDEFDLSLRLGPSQPYDVANLDNSKKGNLESISLELEERMRKRKGVVGNLYEDFEFCWRAKASSGNSNGG